jgi:hypothetical protein
MRKDKNENSITGKAPMASWIACLMKLGSKVAGAAFAGGGVEARAGAGLGGLLGSSMS